MDGKRIFGLCIYCFEKIEGIDVIGVIRNCTNYTDLHETKHSYWSISMHLFIDIYRYI